jgi:Condensation domain
VTERGPSRLSFGQLRLLFLEQLGLENPCYNLAAAVRITGRLDAGALRGAVRTVVARHEILRTRFLPAGAGREPLQEPHGAFEPDLPATDASGDPDPEAAAIRLAKARAIERFDLLRGPLLRLHLVRLGPDAHVLALAVHHIAFDGWSGACFVRELAAAYHAATGDDVPSTLGAARRPLEQQYAEFAEWQREHRSAAAMGPAVETWRRLLAGFPPALTLPEDAPRPAWPTFAGARAPLTIPEDVTGDVRRLARALRATPFMVLLAAYAAFLGALSGQRRVVVGCPVAGRGSRGLEAMIGFLVNTVPVPVELDGGAGFDALVERVKRTCLEVFAHAELPLDQLVEALRPPRDPSRNPLFQAVLSVRNGPPPAVAAAGMRWELRWLELDTCKFDLVATIGNRESGMAGHLTYPVDVWSAASASAFAARFLATLAGAAREPATPVARLLGETALR